MSCVHVPVWLSGSVCTATIVAPMINPISLLCPQVKFQVPVSLPHFGSPSAPVIPASSIVATKSDSSVHSPATSILDVRCHTPAASTTSYNTTTACNNQPL
jgi:hypothetical protein